MRIDPCDLYKAWIVVSIAGAGGAAVNFLAGNPAAGLICSIASFLSAAEALRVKRECERQEAEARS